MLRRSYDAILLALSDAEEVARKLVEAQQLNGSTSSGPSGARDVHFVHSYIIYQLLSRRIQRDLLVSALLSSSTHGPTARGQVDSRLYPAVVKLLDTVLQSLDQMRTLSIVDDSPDLAAGVEGRTSFTKARRCLYLAQCYAPVKRLALKRTWFAHNGGAPTSDKDRTFEKPLFFNIALNYVELDMERLAVRAGKHAEVEKRVEKRVDPQENVQQPVLQVK
ncbi:hypothetical protein DXG01_008971 [Tephrocybe rancida]|nr:hypothetical protein DXG01_008971 [Tephrocybe rancida]